VHSIVMQIISIAVRACLLPESGRMGSVMAVSSLSGFEIALPGCSQI
jgi:hypothetical protein